MTISVDQYEDWRPETFDPEFTDFLYPFDPTQQMFCCESCRQFSLPPIVVEKKGWIN